MEIKLICTGGAPRNNRKQWKIKEAELNTPFLSIRIGHDLIPFLAALMLFGSRNKLNELQF